MTLMKHRNRLASEKSPYLLQHADNPVDWHPWGDEAFEKARNEDKPIFLSIGYSTCHWCHVMAHESFEDDKTARLLNDSFVCVKVDREERPDLDAVYMSVCQTLTGSGGWPLTIIMTPDKKPFFAATYIPKENRFGRTGLMALIPQISEAWKKRRGEIENSAERVVAVLSKTSEESGGGELGKDALDHVYRQLAASFDEVHGGFGGAPKFPSPHNLLFLLRYWSRNGKSEALEMVERTLQAMRMGGIYDQIGFGFHRYSTDAEWFAPHFEKMLYDQAMLSMAYVEAYQATRKEEFARTAREIFTYVLRDMTSKDGEFYSAEDADSEGVEGKFYLWSLGEIKRTLQQDEANLVIDTFSVVKEGNFAQEPTGGKPEGNILRQLETLPATALRLMTSKEDLQRRLEVARKKLFEEREKRVHPHKDDKILADWNGLMIASFAKAAQALDEPRYAEVAGRAADFVLSKMRGKDGRLLHRYRDGEAAVPGNLDDYAFMAWGLIELYEATFDVGRLRTAMELSAVMLERFWDAENGGFYFTADDTERTLYRQKTVYDGAIPSGNSVAMLDLLRLGRMTGDIGLEDRAAGLSSAFSGSVNAHPAASTFLMSAVDFALGPANEVVIVGGAQADDTKAMLRALRSQFLPRKVVLFRPSGGKPETASVAGFVESMSPLEGKATAYVCTHQTCSFPTNDARKMMELLVGEPAKDERE